MSGPGHEGKGGPAITLIDGQKLYKSRASISQGGGGGGGGGGSEDPVCLKTILRVGAVTTEYRWYGLFSPFNIEIDAVPGIHVGDLILVTIKSYSGQFNNFLTPTGWTRVLEGTETAEDPYFFDTYIDVFYKYAEEEDVGLDFYSFYPNADSYWLTTPYAQLDVEVQSATIAYRGVNPTSPTGAGAGDSLEIPFSQPGDTISAPGEQAIVGPNGATVLRVFFANDLVFNTDVPIIETEDGLYVVENYVAPGEDLPACTATGGGGQFHIFTFPLEPEVVDCENPPDVDPLDSPNVDILLAGGTSEGFVGTSSVHSYDIELGYWTVRDDIQYNAVDEDPVIVDREGAFAFCTDQSYYPAILGGVGPNTGNGIPPGTGTGTNGSSFYFGTKAIVFSASGKEWYLAGDIPDNGYSVAVYVPAALNYPNSDRIYIFAGGGQPSYYLRPNVAGALGQGYAATAITSCPAAVDQTPMWGEFLDRSGVPHILVYCRVAGSNQTPHKPYLYNVATDTWVTKIDTAAFSSPQRNEPAIVATFGGSYLMQIGGHDGNNGALNTVFIHDISYSPGAAGGWYVGNSMNVRRKHHTAIVLNGGNVLVVGGTGNTSSWSSPASDVLLSSCEVYNRITGTWSMTGSLNHKRELCWLQKLPDGKILAVGGWDSYTGGGEFMRKCEIYNPDTGLWSYTGSLRVGKARMDFRGHGNSRVDYSISQVEVSTRVRPFPGDSFEWGYEFPTVLLPTNLYPLDGDGTDVIGGADLDTVVGTVTFGIAESYYGKDSVALPLSGSGLRSSNTSDLNMTTQSFSCFVRFKLDNSQGNSNIVGKRIVPLATTTGWHIFSNTSNGSGADGLNVGFKSSIGPNITLSTTGGRYAYDNLYHDAMVTVDRTNNIMTLYTDQDTVSVSIASNAGGSLSNAVPFGFGHLGGTAYSQGENASYCAFWNGSVLTKLDFDTIRGLYIGPQGQ